MTFNFAAVPRLPGGLLAAAICEILSKLEIQFQVSGETEA